MGEARSRMQAEILLYGNPDASISRQDYFEDDLDNLDVDTRAAPTPTRVSAYVAAFEDVVSTVLEGEIHLLSPTEIAVFKHIGDLSYPARYCLARLLVRQPGTWYRFDQLASFESEIKEGGLRPALAELCRPINFTQLQEDFVSSTQQAFDAQNIVKLEPTEVNINPAAGPSRPRPTTLLDANDVFESIINSQDSELFLDYLCENQEKMTIEEMLESLNKDAVASIAKQLKSPCGPGLKKEEIVKNLLSTARGQSTIKTFAQPTPRKGKDKAQDSVPLKQTQLPWGKKPPPQDSQARLRELALKAMGSSIRVNFGFFRLMRRMHIICFRATTLPPFDGILRPNLLSRFKKWKFAEYSSKRTSNVWANRKEMLDYEQALELEQVVKNLLETPDEAASVRQVSQTPAPPSSRRKSLPATPNEKRRGGVVVKEDPDTPGEGFGAEPDSPPVSGKQLAKSQRLKKVKELLEDHIWPRWQQYFHVRALQESSARTPGFERFEIGYVYTRMVQTAMSVLGPLKEYVLEKEVLQNLLGQRFWRRGKRATWHERRAIVSEHLLRCVKDSQAKREGLFASYGEVKDALMDEDTSLVWRPKLVRRLRKLEKRLHMPPEECVVCERELEKAHETTVEAVRVKPEQINSGGVMKSQQHQTIMHYLSTTKVANPKETQRVIEKSKHGKSSWRGATGEVVNVETVVLQYYEIHGYKGMHAETRILTMIFSLLFWDIIFAAVPGAFETAYQNAPLDMFEETFMYARSVLIDARLEEIVSGKGSDVLSKHYDLYHEKKTFCVGMNWDFCTKEDLVEIVECLGGDPLKSICKLFCEDYQARSSGVPDLIVWKASTKECKFVEVKGPGDTLQENQRLWLDALLLAGADVELCHVRDINAPNTPPKVTKLKRKKGQKKTDEAEPEEADVDYDELDRQSDVCEEREEASASPAKRRRTLP